MGYRAEGQDEDAGSASILKKFGLVLGGLAVIVLAKGAGILVGRTTVDQFNQGRQEGQFEAALSQAAATIRAQAPIKVDAVTTLTGAVAAGKEIIYMMDVDEDIASDEIAEARSTLQRSTQQNVCSNAKTKGLIRAGGTMTYQYHLPSGAVITVSIQNCV